MPIIKLLSVAALVGSIAWMVVAPDYEPALAIVASLSTLIANFVIEKHKGTALIQRQKVSGDGVGIQAGGDATVGDIRRPAEWKPDAK